MYRRILGLMLLVGMVCFSTVMAVAGELTVVEEETRVVTGIEVEVSSLHHRLNVGSHVVDGDLATMTQRWISQKNDAEPWLMLMLPDTVTSDTLVLYSGMDAKDGDQYIVDTFVIEALQGADWIQVGRVENNVDYRCVATFPATTASAWRIRFTQGNDWTDPTDNRARVFEVRLLQVK